MTDADERSYFKQLPTSFKLKPEVVDELRAVASRIINASPEYQRLLNDLK